MDVSRFNASEVLEGGFEDADLHYDPDGPRENSLNRTRAGHRRVQSDQLLERIAVTTSSWEKKKLTIWRWLEFPLESKKGKTLHTWISVAVVISVLCITLESVRPIQKNGGATAILVIYAIANVILSAEVIARVALSPTPSKTLTRPATIIDVLSLLPFYLEVMFSLPRSFEILRLVRFLQIVRIEKGNAQFQVFSRTVRKSLLAMYPLSLVAAFLIAVTAMFMYGAELEGAQESRSIQSIGESMWWTVITFTTVGYGDYVPVSIWGKLVGFIVNLIGIVLREMPASILGSRCLVEYEMYARNKRCKNILAYVTKQMRKKSVERRRSGFRSGPKEGSPTLKRRSDKSSVARQVPEHDGVVNLVLFEVVPSVAILGVLVVLSLRSIQDYGGIELTDLRQADLVLGIILCIDMSHSIVTCVYYNPQAWLKLMVLLEVVALSVWAVEMSDSYGPDSYLVLRSLCLGRLCRVMERTVMRWEHVAQWIDAFNQLWLSSAGNTPFIMLVVNWVVILVGGSAAAYYFGERGLWNEEAGQYQVQGEPIIFANIPEGFYWAAQTVSTVGFGDQVPISEGGKLWTAVMIMPALVMVTLPLSILSVSIVKAMKLINEKPEAETRERRLSNRRKSVMDNGGLAPESELTREDFLADLSACRELMLARYPEFVYPNDTPDLLVDEHTVQRLRRSMQTDVDMKIIGIKPEKNGLFKPKRRDSFNMM